MSREKKNISLYYHQLFFFGVEEVMDGRREDPTILYVLTYEMKESERKMFSVEFIFSSICLFFFFFFVLMKVRTKGKKLV